MKFLKFCDTVDEKIKNLGIKLEEKYNSRINNSQLTIKKITHKRCFQHYDRADVTMPGLPDQIEKLPTDVIKIAGCLNVNISNRDINYFAHLYMVAIKKVDP
uniref:Uncharacterized protein n=1 Tax=Glossina pallidipes TaxID=7398 RepID=A0A1B0A571_GLOPL